MGKPTIIEWWDAIGEHIIEPLFLMSLREYIKDKKFVQEEMEEIGDIKIVVGLAKSLDRHDKAL